MSWSFTAHAKSKEGLKRHSRQCLAGYHTAGSPGHKLMSALADRFDSMIDLFHFPAGKTVLMKTDGHIDGNSDGSVGGCSGGFRLELTTHDGDVVE